MQCQSLLCRGRKQHSRAVMGSQWRTKSQLLQRGQLWRPPWAQCRYFHTRCPLQQYFPKISAKIWINWDSLQGSNQQRRRQGSKSVAEESGLVWVYYVTQSVQWRLLVQLCAPSTGLHPEDMLGFSSRRGKKHCSLFPCLIAAAKEGWPQMCFFPAKGHRKILPGKQTLPVGYYLWHMLV